MGSDRLVRSLLLHGLVDELFIMVRPIVVGSGQRLVGDADHPHRVQPIDSTVTGGGVVMTTYRPAVARMPS